MKAIKQHRKLLSIVLALAMIFGVFSIMPLSVSAADPAEAGTEFKDGALTYTVNTDDITTVTVTGYDDSIATEVVIPEKVTNDGFQYTVTDIKGATTVFRANTNITSINIPGTVKTIANYLCYNCTSLVTVTLNEGTEVVGSIAFSDTAITKIEFPTSINTINNSSFAKTQLEEITLQNINVKAAPFTNITTLKRIYVYKNVQFNSNSYTFNGCVNIEDVYFYDRDTTIPSPLIKKTNETLTIHGYEGSTAEEYAKNNNFKFEKIEVTGTTEPIPAPKGTVITQSPFTFTVTDNRASSPAVSITGVESTVQALEIPSTVYYEGFTYTVTAIGDSAFKGNTNITSVNIPGTIKEIGEKSFQNCTSLATVTLNEGITILGRYAFANTAITSINIPGTVNDTNGSTFADCTSLTEVTLNEGTTRINGNCFQNTAITKIEFPDSITQISGSAFSKTKLEEVTLKDVRLDMSSFGYCENLKTIHFYGDVTLINSSPFSGCTAIEDAYFYNKDMQIPDTLLARTNSTLTVHGYSGSTAQTYAEKSMNSIGKPVLKFVPFDPVETEATTVPETEPTTNATEPTTNATEPTTDATEATTATETEATETTEPTSTPAPVYEEFVLGDADGNGTVNIKDVTYIQLYLAKLLNETVNSIPVLSACEVDGDGDVTIKDVTYIQLWLAKFDVEFNIGELVKKEITPGTTESTTPSDSETDPTTEETEPTTATAPSTEETEPTTAPDPNGTIKFYVPNDVTWLTDVGGKMWLYNNETKEFKTMEYDTDNNYFFLEIPVSWSELSIYRTPYETSEEQFNINDKRTETNSGGVILNYWENLGSRGDNDCYYITADREGYYKKYTPPVDSGEKTRTIYFDNSKTKWSEVYIYGWNTSMGFVTAGNCKDMINIGNDIWSFTFEEGYLPKDGIKGFLFRGSTTSWDQQTEDLATEEGKNLFIPNSGSGKVSGTWGVYNP